MSQVTAREGRMFVTRHFKGKDEESSTEPLEVQKFEAGSSPAHVHVKFGTTINLGNFESVRLDVGVTLPCYAEETDAAMRAALAKAKAEVQRQVAEVTAKEESKKRGAK